MIDTDSQRQAIRGAFPVLDGGEPSFLREFFDTAIMARVPKGKYIFREGDECSHLALLISGRVRVYKIAESGREITLYRIAASESCILTVSCIMSGIPFPALAVAETDLQAALVPAAPVCQWMGQSEAWRKLIFGMISQRFSDVLSVLEEVTFQRMDSRIAAYLLSQLKTHGRSIEITHQQIAAELGTSREVVSRILGNFESQGMISRYRGKINVLDRVKLENKVGMRLSV
jgi:CRP/FNR family transcriptional regulator